MKKKRKTLAVWKRPKGGRNARKISGARDVSRTKRPVFRDGKFTIRGNWRNNWVNKKNKTQKRERLKETVTGFTGGARVPSGGSRQKRYGRRQRESEYTVEGSGIVVYR